MKSCRLLRVLFIFFFAHYPHVYHWHLEKNYPGVFIHPPFIWEVEKACVSVDIVSSKHLIFYMLQMLGNSYYELWFYGTIPTKVTQTTQKLEYI